jgi:D-glycerate 3-kinase
MRSDDLAAFLAAERLPDSYLGSVERLCIPLAEAIAARAAGALVVGLTGPQGSGKSTAAAVVARLLAERGLRAAVLALDDLYLPRAARQRLARQVHPLFATRGVPGTHDAGLGCEVLESLLRPGQTLIPRFDKASDDRLERDQWTRIEGPIDVVLFEGWCVGARPQDPAALAAPVNELERERDPDGTWRAAVNASLAGPYQGLFAPIGFQALLRPPAFEQVLTWRLEQEHKLRARQVEAGAAVLGQSDAEIATFIQHYERLTRHIDVEMPPRADAVAKLGPAWELLGLDVRPG